MTIIGRNVTHSSQPSRVMERPRMIVPPNRPRVSVNLFSGFQNPTWALKPEKADSFAQRLRALPKARQDTTSRSPQPFRWDVLDRPRAGYRGIELFAPDSRKPAFVVFGRKVLDVKAGVVREDITNPPFEAMIWGTIPEIVLRDLRDVTLAQIRQPLDEGPIQGILGPYVDLNNCQEAPRYAGVRSRFNDENVTFNNCYNYATDVLNEDMTMPTAKPGAGTLAPGFDREELKAKVEEDGLEFLGMHLPTECPPRDSHYIVVMMRRLAGVLDDFHCIRMDRSGRWSHKDGVGAVTNKDDRGDVMENLLSANIGGSPMCAGFFLMRDQARPRIN